MLSATVCKIVRNVNLNTPANALLTLFCYFHSHSYLSSGFGLTHFIQIFILFHNQKRSFDIPNLSPMQFAIVIKIRMLIMYMIKLAMIIPMKRRFSTYTPFWNNAYQLFAKKSFTSQSC